MCYLNGFVDLVTIIVSGIGVVLFSYWWYKMRRATPAYVYVMIILLSIAVEKIIEYCFESGITPIIKILKYDIIWYSRGIILFAIITLLVSHMGFRFVRGAVRLNKIKKRIKSNSPKKNDFYIMVVEDDPAIPSMIRQYMESYCKDIFVIEFSNAEDAIKYIKSGKRLHLILCDMLLSGRKSGIDICTEAKKNCPWVVIIGMTGYPVDFSFWEARRVGCDDYYVKPFRLSDLSESIAQYRRKIKRWDQVMDRK